MTDGRVVNLSDNERWRRMLTRDFVDGLGLHNEEVKEWARDQLGRLIEGCRRIEMLEDEDERDRACELLKAQLGTGRRGFVDFIG
jgi:hypothetical protein